MEDGNIEARQLWKGICDAKLLYVPLYSADLNTVEHYFSALKKIRQLNHTKSIDQIVNFHK